MNLVALFFFGVGSLVGPLLPEWYLAIATGCFGAVSALYIYGRVTA